MNLSRLPASFVVIALACAAPARGGDLTGTLDPPTVTRSRGLTTIAVRGKLAAPTDRPLVVRLRRATPGPLDDDRAALEAPPKLEADGAFIASLSTPGLLAAGTYSVEVALAGDAARSTFAAPLTIGSAEEAAAAEKRLVAWYRGAYGTFRDLAAGLERRGQYHLTLLQRTGDDVHRKRFLVRFLEGWRGSLLAARMDLATWERRVVLPAHARIGATLLRLVSLLDARAEAWKQALLNPALPVDAPTKAAVDAARDDLCIALAGLEPDPLARARLLAEWEAGPLADPPPGAPAGTEALKGVSFAGGWGVVRDAALGFTLDVPEGATALAADQTPNERAILDVPALGTSAPFRAIVQVRDFPGLQDDELAAALEVGAWEGYPSYERREGRALTAAEGGPGLRLALDAEYYQRADESTGTEEKHGWIRIVQRSLWRRLPNGVPRVVTVVIVRPHDHDHPEKDSPSSPEMDRLEASLKLLGGP